MITTADLKAQTRRELADLAKNYGIAGWHGMKKDELVSAITKVQRRLRRKGATTGTTGPKSARSATERTRSANTTKARSTSSTSSTSRAARGSSAEKKTKKAGSTASSSVTRSRSSKSPAKPSTKKRADSGRIAELTPPRVSAKTARIRAQMRKRSESIQRNRDLSTGTLVGGSAVKSGADRRRAGDSHRDRVVLLVRDSYWLQASWEITRASVQRAQSALAERWHTATPVLRLLSVGDVNSNRAESIERDIKVHGGVNSWYIDVDEPPARFRVVIGYLADNDEFHVLCRSNVVETPRPGECDRLDEHWRDVAEDYERIYSLSGGYDTDEGDLKEMFEERMHRTMPLRGEKGRTVNDPALLRETRLPFEVDAELIVFGKTSPTASVMVSNRPVKLQPDGSFTVRMELPDKRQVLPVTTESRDGLRQRTTVIAVERNTKAMEVVELDERI